MFKLSQEEMKAGIERGKLLLEAHNRECRQKALDIQIGGSHYKTGIQPWEYIEANNLDFFEGNVIKYVTRKKGNRLEDLEKAKHYIEYLIEREKDGKLPKTP